MADQTKPTPKSEVPITKLSPEERRERYAQLRGKMGRSRIAVESPEGITAIWASKNDEDERSRMDWMGFKLVREDMKAGAKRRFQASGLKEDGTYVIGDVILMEIDTESYELMKQIEVDDFEQMRSNIPQEFITKANEAKALAFEVNEKNEKVFATATK